VLDGSPWTMVSSGCRKVKAFDAKEAMVGRERQAAKGSRLRSSIEDSKCCQNGKLRNL
jgi:hypothetical protein